MIGLFFVKEYLYIWILLLHGSEYFSTTDAHTNTFPAATLPQDFTLMYFISSSHEIHITHRRQARFKNISLNEIMHLFSTSTRYYSSPQFSASEVDIKFYHKVRVVEVGVGGGL